METTEGSIPTLETGAYAEHLAEVNKTQAVRASGDVYSVHGVLICRRGAAIDYETARKIVRHKLTMPLDQSVELEHSISARGLVRRFAELAERYTDVAATDRRYRFSEVFENVATRRPLPPIIAQKLTVMNHRLPGLMDHTLLGAWMACLIGQRLGLGETDLSLLFLAGVSRDVGMLHIDPTLVDPSARIVTPDEWRTIQSHAVVSHMILKECEGVPERVLEAVLEHHEHIDGTGYPSSKGGSDLGDWGQILGVADTVSSLRLTRFAGSGRNIRDAFSVVQADSDACRPSVAWAALEVLWKSGVKRSAFHRYANLGELKAMLHRRARVLVACSGVLNDMPNLIPVDSTKAHTPKVLTAIVDRLSLTLLRSGLADGVLVEWLAQVVEGKEPAEPTDLAELDLQQRELLRQLRRLRQRMAWYAEKKNLRSQSPIRVSLGTLDAALAPLDEAGTGDGGSDDDGESPLSWSA